MKMNKYEILFIEDKPSNVYQFKAMNKNIFNTHSIELPVNLEDVTKKVLSTKVQAIIIDHYLGEKNPQIKYTGTDILRVLSEKKPEFPIFILTSHEGEAFDNSFDVNKIYTKEKYLENSEPLNKRIIKQIDNYLKMLTNKEAELRELLDKSKSGELSAPDESRLIELDSFLENSLCSDLKVPPELKNFSNAEKLNKLIAEAEEILEAIKNE